MKWLVARTCTEGKQDDKPVDGPRSRPISDFRATEAYVLLGDPGAGKTTVFEQEATEQDGTYVTVRDLITFDDRPEWHDRTLFIDGLDEVRAGVGDVRVPFDAVRRQLDRLGRPRFRLSCREADWLGTTDRAALIRVAPGGTILELHLDPLTEDDVESILAHDPRVRAATEFVAMAEVRGLAPLLRNPQVLDMLIEAVAGGEWPQTRIETFDLACRRLLTEHNEEHRIATRARPAATDELLEAAGFLCALQLISGGAGYATDTSATDASYPALEDLDYPRVETLRRVAASKVFRTDGRARITYLHRSVAEYLGARHLAARLDDGALPLDRILALITGEDGGVVSALRGLFAWLAALSGSSRSALIERDPLGVVLYGDVSQFNPEEKGRILSGLERETERYVWFRSTDWTAHPLGALATPDMEEQLRAILVSPDRGPAHQALADLVVDAIAYGKSLPGLLGILLATVRDASWWTRIRQAALDAVLRQRGMGDSATGDLKDLIADIHTGHVSDPDDELLGTLLTALYPQDISPADVLEHLHPKKDERLLGRYPRFWARHLVERSSDGDVRILLDGLARRGDTLEGCLDRFALGRMIGGLVEQALAAMAEAPDVARLFEWLRLGLDRHGFHSVLDQETEARIRGWLSERPELQKAIIDHGLRGCAGNDRLRVCMYRVGARLLRAEMPPDYGLWCLRKATEEKDEQVARYLLEEAAYALRSGRGAEGLSRELLESEAQRSPRLGAWIEELLRPRADPEERAFEREQRAFCIEEAKRRQEWASFYRQHEAMVRDGSAPPHLLHHLATAYFGYYIEAEGETAEARLLAFLDGDPALVTAVLEGLPKTIERADVPSVRDILALIPRDQISHLCRPVLAGLAELSRTRAEAVLDIADERLEQALACRFAHGDSEDPAWLGALLDRRPELVAKVLSEYAVVALRAGKSHVAGLYPLAYDKAWTPVARHAVLAILARFPTRARAEQLGALDYTLKAALRHGDRKELLALVAKRLGLRSLTEGQRARWLATGLIADAERYLRRVAKYVEGSETRSHHLAGFLSGEREEWAAVADLPEDALVLLVRLLGRWYPPRLRRGEGFVSPAMEAADLTGGLIGRLGARPSAAATSALEDLLARPELREWHEELRGALYHQQRRRREASFRHPDIGQVNQALLNRAPASVADLAALTFGHLRDLARRIRDGNTDDYKQYWNLDTRGHPESPRHEDACRDALLSDLKARLSALGVDAQPEGQYAEDKRADIRIGYGGAEGFNVPVEIKRSDHRDLWHAIRGQLMERYSRDPGAAGYGIYLVLWFGPERVHPPPEGPRPRTAGELADRLETLLSAEERQRVRVCVIDCAIPGQPVVSPTPSSRARTAPRSTP